MALIKLAMMMMICDKHKSISVTLGHVQCITSQTLYFSSLNRGLDNTQKRTRECSITENYQSAHRDDRWSEIFLCQRANGTL
jgi:hypothetical protein